MPRTLRQWLDRLFPHTRKEEHNAQRQVSPTAPSLGKGAMSLGQDANGVAYALDFSTGLITGTAPAPAMGSLLIPVEQCDQQRVGAILTAGGYRVWEVEDTMLVSTFLGEVTVRVKSDVELLCFSCSFLLKEDATVSAYGDVADSLNEVAFIARYYIRDGERLLVEYDWPMSAGMTPAQLLAAVRAFSDHAVRNLNVCDAWEILV